MYHCLIIRDWEKSFALNSDFSPYLDIIFESDNTLSRTFAHVSKAGSFIFPFNGGKRIPNSANSGSIIGLWGGLVFGAILSRGPEGQSVAITGIPHAIASDNTLGPPSACDVRMKTVDFEKN